MWNLLSKWMHDRWFPNDEANDKQTNVETDFEEANVETDIKKANFQTKINELDISISSRSMTTTCDNIDCSNISGRKVGYPKPETFLASCVELIRVRYVISKVAGNKMLLLSISA